jgi:HAD superfamily hydrolase (TIGR01484 family)
MTPPSHPYFGERLAPLARARWNRIDAVFTDVDGTLTTRGTLEGSTLRAIEQLRDGGVRVVLVTGRPAGWGECWARSLPVGGVIAENGGLYFAPKKGGLIKAYAQPAAARRANRARLLREVNRALRAVPGARLSMDSAATEVDIAIDYAEQARLGAQAADRLESLLKRAGVTVARSSVHVNCWIGRFDKLTTARRFVEREWRTPFARAERGFVYVGDSFNDAPMFGGFTHSVGVANVRSVLEHLPTPPAYVTRATEGHGFEELARFILARNAR